MSLKYEPSSVQVVTGAEDGKVLVWDARSSAKPEQLGHSKPGAPKV